MSKIIGIDLGKWAPITNAPLTRKITPHRKFPL